MPRSRGHRRRDQAGRGRARLPNASWRDRPGRNCRAVTGPERRPFRFGLALDASEGRRDRVVETARRAEAAGVDLLMASDHLGNWAALPILQAAAEVTKLRVGTLVLNNDLRHPPVLAQE